MCVSLAGASWRYDIELMGLRTALLWAIAPIAFAANETHWVATWGCSPAPQLPDDTEMRAAKLVFDNQTIREIVHTSIGGDTLRLRLSNAYGTKELQAGAVHVALRASGSGIVPGSDRTVSFNGRSSVSVPANALMLSDPVKLNLPAGGDLAISIFVPKQTAGAGVHYAAQQTAYIVTGDLTRATSFDNPATVPSWVFLTGVDVMAPQAAATVVAFGDSITDGARSTVDANHRWPDILSARLLAAHGRPLGVLDAGIGGNRILHDASANIRFGVNALARFDRDVLAQPGVKYVIVLEGINDLGHAGSSAPASESVTAEDLIAGMSQMIERAREKGIKIFGATLTPFEGTASPGYFTPEKEKMRKAVNEWIRSGKAFDGVIDFDKAVRDPGHPDRMKAEYDGGDHLHPGDGGYKAMGEAIDLSLFK
jgi:lysophospholipase L1-like esterase